MYYRGSIALNSRVLPGSKTSLSLLKFTSFYITNTTLLLHVSFYRLRNVKEKGSYRFARRGSRSKLSRRSRESNFIDGREAYDREVLLYNIMGYSQNVY